MIQFLNMKEKKKYNLIFKMTSSLRTCLVPNEVNTNVVCDT